MEVLSNTLAPRWAGWRDPGDYPSGAGGTALPKHDFIETINGSVRVRVDERQLQYEANGKIPGVKVKGWVFKWEEPNIIQCEPIAFDASGCVR